MRHESPNKGHKAYEILGFLDTTKVDNSITLWGRCERSNKYHTRKNNNRKESKGIIGVKVDIFQYRLKLRNRRSISIFECQGSTY